MIEPITMQECINKTVQTFIVDKVPCSYDEVAGTCLYSIEINGLGCAIGNLVPVSMHYILKERISIGMLYDDLGDFFHLCDVTFLILLQEWHDRSLRNRQNEVEKLKLITSKYGLVWPLEE